MSNDYVNTAEDTDMAECDGEKVVTMMDVLQEQEEFEEDANAVLGASDDKNCTYSKGYIKRQAIYACLTCCSDAKSDPTKRAGICLACSLNCHENHELIELYTRRNFRCDCGNPKFNSHPCQFTPNKTDLNEDNKYNQNFIGIYCICHRPYPDPDVMFEDEMIQCTICEDWLHASHLEATLPGNDQYSEMICKACMEVNEFLHDYSYLAVNVDAEDIGVTLDETVTVEGNVNEQNKILHNGSLELSSTHQETSECENINITMEISNEKEVMKNGISFDTINNIEKESIASVNGLNLNGIVVESNSNEPENKETNNSCISREGEETRGATVTEKTNKVEEEILNINECVVVNASEKEKVSMEIEESQESQQKYPDNTQKECLLASASLLEEVVNTTMENGPVSDPNEFNLKESNTDCNEDTKSLEVTCSVENEATTTTEHGSLNEPTKFNLKESNTECNQETKSPEIIDGDLSEAVTTMDNGSISNPNKFNLEESNTECNQETKSREVPDSVENEGIATTENGSLGDPNKFNLKESNTECNEETKTLEVTCNDENITGSLEHAEINVKVDNSNCKSTDKRFQKIEANSPASVEKTNEEDLIQSNDICNGVDVDLKYSEGSKPDTDIEHLSTKEIDPKLDEKDLLETKEISSEVDTTLNNLESNQILSKIDHMEYTEEGTEHIQLQSTEMSTEEDTVLKNSENSKANVQAEQQSTETDKMDISESTETNINELNNLTDSEACTKTEEQSAETTDEQTEKQEISKSTEVCTNVDNTLNNLEDSELGTKNENQCTNTINRESEEKDISVSTAADTNIETTLNNLEHSVTEDKTVDESTELLENEINNQDVLEPVKVDNCIDVTLNKLEDSTSEAILEKDGTDKIDVDVPEDSVDQSDTLEKATRELLELTSDMVEETEENALVENNYCDDANKDMNSSEILPESHNNETDNKENIDMENTTETGEYTNGDNISQLEQSSCNNIQNENGHKRKYDEEKADVEVKKAKLEEKSCIRPKGVQRIFRGATFWPSEFRQKLCTCNECLTMYKDLRLLFLLDAEDTVTAYETLGKEKIDGTPTTQYEKGLEALSSLDRVQQINALTEYNIMRDKLLDFLKSFKERKEVVKEEDIRAFFAGMKPKREPDGVYFCR